MEDGHLGGPKDERTPKESRLGTLRTQVIINDIGGQPSYPANALQPIIILTGVTIRLLENGWRILSQATVVKMTREPRHGPEQVVKLLLWVVASRTPHSIYLLPIVAALCIDLVDKQTRQSCKSRD